MGNLEKLLEDANAALLHAERDVIEGAQHLKAVLQRFIAHHGSAAETPAEKVGAAVSKTPPGKSDATAAAPIKPKT